MKQHIHIFGASGSGATTIAQGVCSKTNFSHFDSDDYFWLPTLLPFTVERDRKECLNLMMNDMHASNQWILSGSVAGWGDALLPFFDLVVFVYVPQDIRIERLKKREFERYGDRILPGGDRYQHSLDFIEWASAYDAGTGSGRSLSKHEALLKKVTCPVIRLENYDLDVCIEKVTNAISSSGD
jgi:adenylate kinase family enzyme